MDIYKIKSLNTNIYIRNIFNLILQNKNVGFYILLIWWSKRPPGNNLLPHHLKCSSPKGQEDTQDWCTLQEKQPHSKKVEDGMEI